MLTLHSPVFWGISALSVACFTTPTFARSDAVDENSTVSRPFYSVEATAAQLDDASKTLYSGSVSKESAFISRFGVPIYPTEYVVDFPREGVVLGQGWQMDNMKKTPATCIQFSDGSVGGQNATVSAIKVFSSEQLKRETTTSLNASAKGSYGGFSASASYKSSLAKKSNVESSFDTRLLKAEVIDGVDFVQPRSSSDEASGDIRLSQFALGLLEDDKGSLQKFREYCGDVFVSAIERGAEMYVVSNQSNYSAFKSVAAQKSASVGGSYLGSGGSVEGSSSSLSSALNVSKNSEFNYYHSAHRGLYIPSSIEEVSQALRILGDSSDQNKSFPFRVQLTSYTELPDFNKAINELKVPMVDRLYVYKGRLESVKRVLKHVLGYTLMTQKTGENSTQEECSPQNAKSCVRRANLVIYYVGHVNPDINLDVDTTWGNSEQVDAARLRYANLLSAVEKEIAIVQKEINNCFGADATNGQCIARFDGKYNDYFYLALLPLPKIVQLYISQDDKANLDQLKQRLAKLRNDYKEETGRTYRKYKTCRTLGIKWKDKNLCGYDYVTQRCPDYPHGAHCLKIKDKEKAVERDISLYETSAVFANLAEARFDYYIGTRMNYRSDVGAIDVALSEREIQYLKDNIACELNPDGNGCDQVEPIYDRIVKNGERLRFVYVYDEEAKNQKLLGYSESALEDIRANTKQMGDLLQKAINEGNLIPDPSIAPKSNLDDINPHVKELKKLSDEKLEDLIRNQKSLSSSDITVSDLADKILTKENLETYRHLEKVNEELMVLAERLKAYIQDPKSVMELGGRAPSGVIATPEMFSGNEALFTMPDGIQPFGRDKGEQKYAVEPLFPLISLEEDFKLYVQSY
ncbi:ATPase [Vibrio sp. Vb1554]|uniref:ATPase n=1 Tax=Vibrio sp. Vb1554 TaxID=3074642 RepID=UPI0021CEEEFF|nr:ATPase [Vibrio sp. Vb1554]MDW3048598.1 ATPase [Vibrio sp. Vb1554]